jgi:hypothetical protein
MMVHVHTDRRRISDQGGGISEDHIEHVFEYAYTTASVCEALLNQVPILSCLWSSSQQPALHFDW